jgi:hypothetical protein
MSKTSYSPDESPGRAAVIEIRRFVNDEIYRVGFDLDGDERSELAFVCECGELRCTRLVNMTLAEFAGTQPGSVVAH